VRKLAPRRENDSLPYKVRTIREGGKIGKIAVAKRALGTNQERKGGCCRISDCDQRTATTGKEEGGNLHAGAAVTQLPARGKNEKLLILLNFQTVAFSNGRRTGEEKVAIEQAGLRLLNSAGDKKSLSVKEG